MKKIFLITTISIFCTSTSFAQLGGLMNKVKSKVNQRVDKKTDEAIDKSLDKAEGKQQVEEPVKQTEEKEEPASDAVAKESSLKSFARYDFVPGEKIVNFDNFEQESLAELPVGLYTNGTGEVVTLDKYPGQWLRVHGPFVYLTSNQKEFTDSYTAEFDIIMQLKNNGWMYPEIKVGLFSSKDENATDNSFLKGYAKYSATVATIYPGEFKSSKVDVSAWLDNKSYFKSEVKPFAALDQWYGQPIHVAIQVQKERFRIWINEEKLFDVPKGIPLNYIMNQLMFEIGHTNYSDAQYAIYVSNIKIATGKPDTRHKLVEEGKFSTTGILFNTNSATIKPESYGVLKEIAEVMKKNEGIRVKVIGHTDSDGSDAANLELSKKRATAVKTALADEFGISEDRMNTDGKGETVPVADNKTKEGKSQNRRVEFIKQ
jgi:OOP family OmpA-OmpF porin